MHKWRIECFNWLSFQNRITLSGYAICRNSFAQPSVEAFHFNYIDDSWGIIEINDNFGSFLIRHLHVDSHTNDTTINNPIAVNINQMMENISIALSLNAWISFY